MRTILITGGSGLLAVNWAICQRDDYRVVLCRHRREVAIAGADNVNPDLGSQDAVRTLLAQVRPSIVVHAAGLTSVEGCEADPSAARSANVEIAANVATAAAEAGCALVHVSTDHLFTGTAPLVTETEPPEPLNVYGATKAEAERRVLAAHPRALVVRTNFYGWGPSYRPSFSDHILSALRSGGKVRLFDDVFYTPILVESLVRATHELLDREASGVFHVVGNDRISKYEFGLMLAERFGLRRGDIERGKLADHAGLVRRPLDMSLSNAKAAERLGRGVASVAQDIDRLWQQEHDGIAAELGKL